MFNWKRTPWVAALALGAVLVLAGGCGDDDDDDGDGGGLEARNGTWNMTISSSSTGPGTCPGTEEPVTIPLPLCDIDDPGDISGGGDDEQCDVDEDGNEVTFHCTEQTVSGGCTTTLHTDGEGTFSEESIMMTFTTFETVSPTSEVCLAQIDPCTTTIVINATYVNANGCDSKPTVPAGAVVKRLSRLAGTH
jgi:hypothetical protein